MSSVNFNLSEYEAFFEKIGKAAKGDFKNELQLFLEGIGDEFLRVLQDEIVRRNIVDTRLLLASFEKSGNGSVWNISDGGLTLEVGTNVEYASYVNNGHWTNSKGVESRFVPGYWQGDKFIYDPSASSGMVLKQKWIEGKPFFDSALRIIEKMFPKLFEERFQKWFDDYFGL